MAAVGVEEELGCVCAVYYVAAVPVLSLFITVYSILVDTHHVLAGTGVSAAVAEGSVAVAVAVSVPAAWTAEDGGLISIVAACDGDALTRISGSVCSHHSAP